jgi:SHS2 domain-containing protein
MTDINGILPKRTVEINAKGSDAQSLLFSFLDEFLFLSSIDDYFMLREVHILEFDRENWTIHARGFGEDFDQERHGGQGTEVKAITYSAMQVLETDEKSDIFVIIDI